MCSSDLYNALPFRNLFLSSGRTCVPNGDEPVFLRMSLVLCFDIVKKISEPNTLRTEGAAVYRTTISEGKRFSSCRENEAECWPELFGSKMKVASNAL